MMDEDERKMMMMDEEEEEEGGGGGCIAVIPNCVYLSFHSFYASALTGGDAMVLLAIFLQILFLLSGYLNYLWCYCSRASLLNLSPWAQCSLKAFTPTGLAPSLWPVSDLHVAIFHAHVVL